MIWWDRPENWGAWAHLHRIYCLTWVTRANLAPTDGMGSAATLARDVRMCYSERARNIREARIRARRITWQ